MTRSRILPSFAKGLRLFERIAASPDGLRQADLSRESGIPASNLSLYLNTLERENLVLRDPVSRRYCVHPRAVGMIAGARGGMVHRLIGAAEAPVAGLRERFNENVLLGVPRETTISVVHYRMTGRTLRIGVEPDRDFPLHVVAMGRCILAHLPERELERYLAGARFEKLTAKTIDDPDRLRRELARVRADGWAFNEGEFEPEIMAAAAPVLFDERPLAAISVQFPTVRHERAEALAACPEVRSAAARVAASLETVPSG